MYSRPIIIGLVACETSGDILGASLMRALRKHTMNNIKFFGVVGPKMYKEGIEAWYKIDDLSVMGIIEIIKYLPKILYIRRDLARRFIILNPDIFIGIDAPEFNIPLEINLKKHGIHTIHYVSPSIWAWRKNRILKISRATDTVLSLFPFEKEIYDKFNIPCQFIGHTLADDIPLDPDKETARRKLGITKNSLCLSLLPGSRSSEIKMLSADFLYCAKLLSDHFRNLEILVPTVNSKLSEQFQKIKEKIVPKLHIRILENQSSQAMIASDAALLASGTATLECMLAKCPMVVCYRMNPISFMIARKFIKIPWISLPNLLAGHELVREFIQESCTPEKLSKILITLLYNKFHRMRLYRIFRQLHQKIKCNASEKAANTVLKFIDDKNDIKNNNK